MTHSSMYPGYCKLKYTRGSVPHRQILPVYWAGAPTPGSEPTLTLKNASTVAADTAIAAYVAAIKPQFHSGVTFVEAEWWRMDSEISDPYYLWTTSLNVAGTSGGTTQVAGQAVFTFRSQNGGILRLYYMETTDTPNTVVNPPYGAGTITKAVADYVTAGTSWITARDNGFLVAPIRKLTKTNDKLRKKLLLSEG